MGRGDQEIDFGHVHFEIMSYPSRDTKGSWDIYVIIDFPQTS